MDNKNDNWVEELKSHNQILNNRKQENRIEEEEEGASDCDLNVCKFLFIFKDVCMLSLSHTRFFLL